ncbi:hypothetical protein ACJX0J_040306, partial [Zea mays]
CNNRKDRKEWAEDAELDRLLLSNLCGDIMEELMDTHSEQELITKKGWKPKKTIKCILLGVDLDVYDIGAIIEGEFYDILGRGSKMIIIGDTLKILSLLWEPSVIQVAEKKKQRGVILKIDFENADGQFEGLIPHLLFKAFIAHIRASFKRKSFSYLCCLFLGPKG